ncbi:MAG: HupE/UreJ family protein [Pseudomonadota bacterium]
MSLHRLLMAAVLALACAATQAHAPSNAKLGLVADGSGVQQRWDIALRDLDRVLPLDADEDGRITWGELRQAWPAVAALADDRLSIALRTDAPAAPAACTAQPIAPPRIEDHADGTYAVVERRWRCPGNPAEAGVAVGYRLFADSDASHRGLLQWQAGEGGTASTAVLVPAAPDMPLPGRTAAPAQAANEPGAHPSALLGFVGEGVHHILIGFDHVLFLLALMLPAVVAPATAAPSTIRWPQALLQVAKVVTAFTVAHSITLAAAVLGIVDPPSRLVESLIAASVVLAALDNLGRFLPGRRRSGAAGRWAPGAPGERWQLAFAFGLVHGFGFAGALRDLGLGEGALATSLLGFNLGVELGQLGIVAVVLPLAWWARHTLFYRRVVLAGGSAAIAAVAALWFTERAFDVALITAA